MDSDKLVWAMFFGAFAVAVAGCFRTAVLAFRYQDYIGATIFGGGGVALVALITWLVV